MPSDTRIGSIVAAALLLLIPHWLQAQVVINFDTDPSGAPIDFPGLSIFEYAGDGLWGYERDYWSVSEAGAAARTYRDAVARFDPSHPARRSRLHWPAEPDWAHP